MHIFEIVVCVLFLSAWLTLCVAKYNKWKSRRQNCTSELTVKVTEVLEKKTSRGGMVYKPIFESVDDARQLIINSAYYSSLVSFEIGDIVELLINPDNPQQFLYKNDSLNKGKIADIACCCIPIIIVIGMILVEVY